MCTVTTNHPAKPRSVELALIRAHKANLQELWIRIRTAAALIRQLEASEARLTREENRR